MYGFYKKYIIYGRWRINYDSQWKEKIPCVRDENTTVAEKKKSNINFEQFKGTKTNKITVWILWIIFRTSKSISITTKLHGGRNIDI